MTEPAGTELQDIQRRQRDLPSFFSDASEGCGKYSIKKYYRHEAGHPAEKLGECPAAPAGNPESAGGGGCSGGKREELEKMDRKVAELMKRLEDDGEMESDS